MSEDITQEDINRIIDQDTEQTTRLVEFLAQSMHEMYDRGIYTEMDKFIATCMMSSLTDCKKFIHEMGRGRLPDVRACEGHFLLYFEVAGLYEEWNTLSIPQLIEKARLNSLERIASVDKRARAEIDVEKINKDFADREKDREQNTLLLAALLTAAIDKPETPDTSNAH